MTDRVHIAVGVRQGVLKARVRLPDEYDDLKAAALLMLRARPDERLKALCQAKALTATATSELRLSVPDDTDRLADVVQALLQQWADAVGVEVVEWL